MRACVISCNAHLAVTVAKCLELAQIEYAMVAPQFSDIQGINPGAELPLPLQMMNAPHSMMAVLSQFIRANGIDTLVACDIPAQAIAHMAHQHMPDLHMFPTPKFEQMNALNDKWLFYQMLERNNLPSPKTWLIERFEQLYELPDQPMIIKPRDLGGGIGIEKVENRDALLELAPSIPLNMVPFLVQEYIEGEDHDVSLLAAQGQVLSICSQRWIDERELEFLELPEAEDICRQIAELSSYDGVVHIDLRKCADTGKYLVIEANPRFWGSALALAEAGLNMAHLGMAYCHGEALPEACLNSSTTVNIQMAHVPENMSLRGFVV